MQKEPRGPHRPFRGIPADRGVVVIAGGLSSRFGSNKGLHTLDGKAMLTRIVERASEVSRELVVVIAKDESKIQYSHLLPDHVRIVNDEPKGKSPLVGMATGLRVLGTRYVAVLSSDIPFVSPNVIAFLFQRASDMDAAIPRWKSGHLEPLHAVYSREPMLLRSEELLKNGLSSPLDAIQRLSHPVFISIEEEIKRIDPELRTFFNINTKQDLAEAEKLLIEMKRTR